MLSNKIFAVVVLLFASFLLTWTNTVSSLNDDIDVIRQRVLELIIWPKPENVSFLVQRVLNFSETLNSSCYWPDLNYTNGSVAIWDTEQHMFRISNMLRALTVNGSSLKNDPKIMSQVHCALQAWFDHDWRNPNWWFNQIGIPLEAGMQLLMLGSNATETEAANLKNITLRAHWWLPSPYYVGANLLWMIQIQIYRCLATRNTTGLEQAFDRMWEDVGISNTTNEGVQPDWGYHFHTRQFLPGSYGVIWANNILLFTQCSADTRYEPNEQVSSLVGNFLARCDAWTMIGSQWDWHVFGRGITSPGATFGNPFETSWIRSLAGIVKSSELKVQLNNFADRLDGKAHVPALVGNRVFFGSDYQIHRRTNWIASIKLQSPRTYPSECILGQNLKHEHLGQGVLNLYRTDYNDYVGVFAILDWQAINGITVEHDIPIVNCTGSSYYYHSSRRFVGGVSDDQYGLAVMDTVSHNLTAQRSWHFYDDAIIALATNLTLNASTTPWTALASRLLPTGRITVGFFNSTIVTLNDGNFSFPYIQNKTSNVQWIHIGESNIGYLLQLQQQYHSLGVQVGNRTGDYITISPFEERVTARMVTLYIDHGRGPFSNLDYNYMILPNISVESMPSLIKKYEEEQVFACISTNGISHGTVWPTLKRAAFVLWINHSTTFSCRTPTFNLNITLAFAGNYLFSENEQNFTLTASNPIRTKGYLNVTVDREGYGEDCGIIPDLDATRTNITLHLPTEGALLGAPVNVTCKKRNMWT